MTYIVGYDNNCARTLEPCYLGYNEASGWTIYGAISEDYYEWVNSFEATHKTYGVIKGDFEHEVTADSKEALDHFLKHHPYLEWDYGDI